MYYPSSRTLAPLWRTGGIPMDRAELERRAEARDTTVSKIVAELLPELKISDISTLQLSEEEMQRVLEISAKINHPAGQSPDLSQETGWVI